MTRPVWWVGGRWGLTRADPCRGYTREGQTPTVAFDGTVGETV
ncbi:MAG TPA: hypothetical protein VIQ24_07075 [Pyrinomonadaceae bacterium]